MNTRRNTRVPERGPGGAGSEGAVAVLQRVDGVFDGLVVDDGRRTAAGGMAIAGCHPRREAGEPVP